MTQHGVGDATDRDRAAAVAFCAARDVACPGCGYNLRDSADAVCPECARALKLRVDAPAPDRRGAVRMSCAWCALLGATFLATEIMSWYLAGGRPRSYSTEDALATVAWLVMLAYGLAGLVALALSRRRPLPAPRAWLPVGWALWALCALYIAWTTLVYTMQVLNW